MKRALLFFFVLSLAVAVGCGSSSDSTNGGLTDCVNLGDFSNQICAYTNTNEGSGCSPGSSPGVCPSSGVVGCCACEATSSDGVTVSTGQCFYSSAAAESWKKTCSSPCYWSTSEPPGDASPPNEDATVCASTKNVCTADPSQDDYCEHIYEPEDPAQTFTHAYLCGDSEYTGCGCIYAGGPEGDAGEKSGAKSFWCCP
jgi:hypothetical protein